MEKPRITTPIILLGLAVIIGAFGAHGLEGKVTPKALGVFETGVRYHFYHAIGLLLLGLYEYQIRKTLKLPYILGVFGIIVFSFNCYLYTITGVKTFAMIVPIGGFSFIGFWFTWLYLHLKKEG